MNRIKTIVVKATNDYPFLGVKAGQCVRLTDDGTCLCCGSRTWDDAKIAEEIKDGLWELMELELHPE